MNNVPARIGIRIAVIVLLFSSSALWEAVRWTSLSSVGSNDIFLHLGTGLWILQHHALPHSGVYSQSGDRPWALPSWAFDVLAAAKYKVLGLGSIPVLLMGFRTGLGILTFSLAGGWRGRFWPAVMLSAAAQYILGGMQPGPAYCSALLFAGTLLTVTESRRTGSARPLWILLPLFLVWANMDSQFVYGIGMLVLYLASTLPAARPASSQKQLVTMVGLAVTVTLVTPSFYHPYSLFFTHVASPINQYLGDAHALTFHQPRDYALLLLTMSGFFALGMRRSRDPFLILLMIVAAAVSFHAQRDAWLVVLAAIAVIREAIGTSAGEAPEPAQRWKWAPSVACGVSLAILMLAAAIRIPRSPEALMAKVAQSYPVAACDFIREQRLPQPLFNAYEWGGFLIWYLAEYPVAIDSREGWYDEDHVVNYFKAMNAEVPYSAYPPMAEAQTILLPKKSTMAEALSTLPAFRVAYSDGVAVVLVKQ